MFGYVRPQTPELKVRELESFKALYCGMCHTLGKTYGLAARFILSYDFVFLCALTWPPEETPCFEKRRCPAGFKKKNCVCNANPATKQAAGCGVILAYHKLRDNADDEGLFKRIAARLGMLLLRRAYKRASRDFPDFDRTTHERLRALSELEQRPDSPPDALADAFAGLLADLAAGESDETRRRVFENLLYHLGRWLYYTDARDDLREDTAKDKPNPLKNHPMDDETLETTLRHSNNLASSAFELLPETAWSGINRNILYLGLPAVLARVLAGEAGSERGYRNI